MQEQNRQLHTMVENLTISIQDSQLEKSKLQEHLRESQETIAQLEEQLQSSEASKQQLHDANTQVKQNNQRLQQQVQRLQQEIQRLQTAENRPAEDKQLHCHWVVSDKEIEMTGEVLGTGGWGEVKVAKFRGLKVAAKCLHAVILSPYNLKLFVREMEMASRIRHPNLLQFIGATKEGSPIILLELMPTSLRNELENGPLTRTQVLKIGLDVAGALNYLHLWKPNPIIHRDVSSANVLLEPFGINAQWRAKLSDYGSANIQQKISTKSVAPGCPVYAAPESRFPDEHSPAMDIYSYGVLITEMILGEQPGFTTIERQQQCEDIKWPSFKDLVKRCIATERESRVTIAMVMELLQNM